jgi:REP element-mobilizing transposase RayT
VKGGCYFFIVALAEQWGSLLTENVEGLRTAFREVKQAHPFEMEASVILPDHLHLTIRVIGKALSICSFRRFSHYRLQYDTV